MTLPSSTPSQDARDRVDTGSLSWVMGEIREALNRCKTAVRDAVVQDAEAQSTALRHAKSYLHQAHGALQIVDIDGVVVMTQTVEELLDLIGSGQIALTDDHATAIDEGCQALVEYLEELLSGMPHQPLRLFPYYRALRAARGAERIHPADLFFPDLSVRPRFAGAESVAPAAPSAYAGSRQRYEKALLPFLKNTDAGKDLEYAAAIRDVLADIERMQGDQQARAFWWVMHGLGETVAAGRLASDVVVKQLFARINVQIRHLAQGGTSIPEGLLRDALFFIAQAVDPPPDAQRIRSVYRLDGQVPPDYETKRYGRIDVDALAAAKERLSHAKSIWNKIVGGDAGAADSFEPEMRALAEASARLNAVSLTRLLRELKGIARHAAHAEPGDMLGMEMATSLLFIENALNNIGRLPDGFEERAHALTARLMSVVAGEAPAQPADWLDDMAREAQQRQTMVALAGEMQANLRQVEKMLDEYFRDPSQAVALAELDTVLHQIEGALAVLDQEDAVRTIQHTRSAVQRFRDTESAAPSEHEFRQVAQNVGALSFFIDTLKLPSEQATTRFAFDAERGEFRANLVAQKLVPAAAHPVIDVATSAAPLPADESALETAESGQPSAQDGVVEAPADDHLAGDAAQTAAELLAGPDFTETHNVLDDTPAAGIATPASEPLPAVLVPETDEEVDAELLEIFLSEAEEVLAAVLQTLPESRNQPHNQEHLTTLRRCFHTLKGSSRMVGLTAFGEAAWSIEQVMNLRLSASRGGDSELYGLLEKSAEVLGNWVQDLKLDGRSDRTPDALVAAAERVKADGPFVFDAGPGTASTDEGVAALGRGETAAPDDEALTLDLSEPALDRDFATQELLDAGPDVPAALPSDAGILLPQIDAPVVDAQPGDAQPGQQSAAGDEQGAAAGEPVIAIADVIEFPTLQSPENRNDSDNVKRIGDVEISIPLFNIYLAETDDLVRALVHDVAEWRHEPERVVDIRSVHAAHSLAGSSATVGFKALQEVAHALERVLQALARTSVRLAPHEFDTIELSVERIRLMLQKFTLGDLPPHEAELVGVLEVIRRHIEARAEAPDQADAPPSESSATQEPAGVAEQAAPPAELPLPSVIGVTAAEDELDADLLPVFIEEGRDILPQLGTAIRGWQADPSDHAAPRSMLRLLHTMKGSARMAGAMALGEHLHDMESRVENLMRLGAPAQLAIDELLIRYDQSLAMFEHLQGIGTDAAPEADAPCATEDLAASVVAMPSPLPVDVPLPVAAPAAPVAVVPSAPVPMVRVRADILDRLVNQAGEVSISRSRLENEVGTLKQSLSELTENVGRLREQLREIEMQAETQIASHKTQSVDRDFDPLEFDRFTRLQELTRMMAESVNDVGSVHQNLRRTLDSAASDLSAQARLTRDLQQDLMRVRMVQFASISERLFRVTRQTAKEVDKRVNLDIRGAAVEIDRSVLEKMTGPFEHLLRNAIVHGIEPRDERRATGKDEAGELLIEVRQEGNEVVIQFADDGRGLDLARIREKAARQGLLTREGGVSDQETAELIFRSGFSTTDEVTTLAGRGVGMDVVRSEAAALGGRVSASSESGKGACFTIRLPLTLAVTQVVLLSTGGKTYAVPSVLVEQVQHLKTNALAAAYNEGAVAWQGQRVPLYYLSALLGDTDSTPVAQQYAPLLILKSGSDRIALHVDDIVGNREVVVKNTGPQLTRMVGIAGATVLGSGDIVLILNPLPLVQRGAHERRSAPRIASPEARSPLGAVAEMTLGAPSATASGPVQGLRTQRTVMIVDDSLTVRRVTQRLLSREGYQVVLAKDGVDALEHLQSVTPDVMLVDIEMPRMDGFDLTRNVRGDERTRQIPIIMITSRTASRHRNYAFELGVNEYLGKPYQEDQLLGLIADFVRKTG